MKLKKLHKKRLQKVLDILLEVFTSVVSGLIVWYLTKD